MAKSEYLQREEAAKKQLGAKGVKKRVKQLPTAARAFTKEMTGIDISRKGVSVDPFAVAMALPVGKVLKAAKVLRAAGNIKKAVALEGRVAAKNVGKKIGSTFSYWDTAARDSASARRMTSESVFPKLPSRGGDSPSILRGQRDLRSFDVYADPYNTGNERVMGAAVRRPGGSIGEAAMPRIASKIKKPKLPKGRGGR